MQRMYFLVVTAIGEGATGLSLLLLPDVVLSPLLGLTSVPPEAAFVARVAGAALLAIAVASWFARHDRESVGQHGLIVGLVIYDVAAAALFAYAGSVLGMAGIVLWPAILVHFGLAAWSAVSLSRSQVAQ